MPIPGKALPRNPILDEPWDSAYVYFTEKDKGGCKWAKTCAHCPFPECFEMHGIKHTVVELRTKLITSMLEQGMTAIFIAEVFRISPDRVRDYVRVSKKCEEKH